MTNAEPVAIATATAEAGGFPRWPLTAGTDVRSLAQPGVTARSGSDDLTGRATSVSASERGRDADDAVLLPLLRPKTLSRAVAGVEVNRSTERNHLSSDARPSTRRVPMPAFSSTLQCPGCGSMPPSVLSRQDTSPPASDKRREEGLALASPACCSFDLHHVASYMPTTRVMIPRRICRQRV